MRITFVLPHAGLSGGVRVVAIHAHNLLARGHEVTVVSTPKRPPSLSRRLKSLVRGRLPRRAPSASHFDGLDVTHHVLECSRPVTAADVPDADVIVATWWETAEWVAAMPASKGAKAYLLQHDETHLSPEKERVRATWQLPMHRIVVSRWLRELAEREFADPDVDLVRNSVDASQFNAPERGKADDLVVGFMYSGAKWKGSALAMSALERVRATWPSVRVVAFGSSKPPAEVLHDPAFEFHHRPPQDAIRDIYARCDAWLFTSHVEGFGLPILEAMACRTPVIGTPAGAAPELIGEGGGILVPEANAGAIADAVLRVARMDDPAWRRMSDAAYRTATSYTWADAAARLEAALRRAIERSASAEPAAGRRAQAASAQPQEGLRPAE